MTTADQWIGQSTLLRPRVGDAFLGVHLDSEHPRSGRCDRQSVGIFLFAEQYAHPELE